MALRRNVLNLRFSAASLWTNASSVQYQSRLPEAPRSPLPPINRFILDNKQSLKGDKLKLSRGELLTIAPVKWKNLSQSEKGVYVTAFVNELRDYREKMKSYKQNLENLGKLEEYETQKAIDRDKKKLRKLKKTKKRLEAKLQKPLRNINSYGLFMKDNFHKCHGDTTVFQVSEAWKNLSPQERSWYDEMGAKYLEEYLNAIQEWKERVKSSDEFKMIQELEIEISEVKKRKRANEKQLNNGD